MKQHRRLLVLAIACVFGFTLVGCAAEDGGAKGGMSQSSDSKSSSSAAAPQKGEEEIVVAPEDCLKGTWIADNDFFLAGMREFGTEPQSVTGDVVITYSPDGTMTTDYQNWLITFLVEGGTTTISRTGVDSGTFTATADTVSIKDTQMGSLMLVTMSGMEMPVDPDPVNYVDVAYTCSATNASLTTSDGEMRMTRR